MMAERIVFMGSPNFAVPAFHKLAEQYRIVGVVTQPDRPSGRGQVLKPPPVKIAAQTDGIETIQPERLNSLPAIEKIKAWNPDLIIVAAYGHILRQNLIGLPRYGCINIHASALPRWRGAAPVQACLLSGDTETGVTIMRMDLGVDTGDVISQLRVVINPQEDAGTLTDRLSILGAQLLMQTLPPFLAGKLISISQNEDLATQSVLIRKEDGALDFSMPCSDLLNRLRAYSPWPGSYYHWGNNILKIFSVSHCLDTAAIPRKHIIVDGKPAVGAKDGWLIFNEIQPANKKRMTGTAFLTGARNWMDQEIIK